MGPFSPYEVASPSLDVKVCARSYCILLWYAQLMFLSLLFFSRGDMGEGIWGDRAWENWQEWRRGSCSQDIVYEKTNEN